ncbi:hypothetical protein VNF293_16210 [Atlantibacter hermannii]
MTPRGQHLRFTHAITRLDLKLTQHRGDLRVAPLREKRLKSRIPKQAIRRRDLAIKRTIFCGHGAEWIVEKGL